MRAFVLGGGGSLGAMQVGALVAMFERGIYPDMLIGCSVGALNAAMVAHEHSWNGLEKLIKIWNRVQRQDIYPGGTFTYIWRALTRQEGLVDNRHLYNYLVRSGLDPELQFGDIQEIPLFITTTSLRTGDLHVFGPSPSDCVIDALMASSAQPPYLAPWEVNGERYIDGGAITPLPLRVALERGATEIYALRIVGESVNERVNKKQAQSHVRGMTNLVRHSIAMMIQQQAEYDLYLTRQWPNVKLRQIQLANTQVSRMDFGASSMLMRQGYEAALDQLGERPLHRHVVTADCSSASDDEPVHRPLALPAVHKALYTAAD